MTRMGRPPLTEEQLETSRLTGKNIRDFRNEADMSQAQLARLAGITADMLSKIETGQRNAGLRTLEKLADVLGRSLDDFMMVDPPPRAQVPKPERAFDLKAWPGVDPDLREKAEAYLRELNREHLQRLRARKKKKSSDATH